MRLDKKTRQYVAGSVLLTVALLLLLPDSTRGRLKVAIGSLFLPLFGLSQSAQAVVVKTGRILSNGDDRQSMGGLELAESIQLREVLAENQRLSRKLGWKRNIRWSVKAARVVGRDPANWWRTLHINLGVRDDLHPNQTVLSSDGALVGRTGEVGPARSQVVLASDPNCRFAALIRDTRNQAGIVSPRAFDPDPRMVLLTYLPTDIQVKPGQLVVTSGLGRMVPKEIPVGRVIDSRLSHDGLHLEAKVKLQADLNTLEEVWVIYPSPSGEEAEP